jgi:diguanylate cyclase (GGDEF)-like protein
VVARYGGEEFIVILPNAELRDALRVAERLKLLVHEENIPHHTSQVADRITISQGVVAVKPSEDVDPGKIIDAADSALYRAKHDGRNRVATGEVS